MLLFIIIIIIIKVAIVCRPADCLAGEWPLMKCRVPNIWRALEKQTIAVLHFGRWHGIDCWNRVLKDASE